MRKRLLVLFMIPAMLLFTVKASASNCDANKLREIKQEASKVKLTYEEVEEVVNNQTTQGGSDVGYDYDVYDTYLKVTISNLTDDLYVKVINTSDNSVKEFYGKDATDGTISFKWTDLKTIAKLELKVYTSSNTSCPDEEILTDYKTLPKMNEYYTWDGCVKNPDEAICKKYVEKDVSYEAYKKVADKETTKKAEKVVEDKSGNKITRFVKKNKKGFIIGGSIIIVLGVVTTAVVIIKRRGSRII